MDIPEMNKIRAKNERNGPKQKGYLRNNWMQDNQYFMIEKKKVHQMAKWVGKMPHFTNKSL